jgi:SAM-dependent methyltransferase
MRNYSHNHIDKQNHSIWGIEDKATKKLLKQVPIKGVWLNLCAGDGRYNNYLLNKADKVIATDIDKRYLYKLKDNTPGKLKNKLVTKVMDITKLFPFKANSFEGILCVGTLHLFPRSIFKKIFKQMERVLKPKGIIIIDFGSLWIIKNEPNYTQQEALIFLKGVFKNYKVKIIKDKVTPERLRVGSKKYTFSSNFILIDAI